MGTNNVESLRSIEYDAMLRVLREARISARVSQEELCRRLGQSDTYIVKIERGTRRLDLVEFTRIALALERDPVGLYTEVVEQFGSSK